MQTQAFTDISIWGWGPRNGSFEGLLSYLVKAASKIDSPILTNFQCQWGLMLHSVMGSGVQPQRLPKRLQIVSSLIQGCHMDA